MKTIIKHILLAVAVLFGILSASASNSVSYSCSFTSSDYTVKDSVFNGKTYSVVSYQDNPVIADQTGAPLLPYRVILVSVPYNSSNFRVRINNAEYNSTELQHCVVPVQTPVSMNAVEMPPFVEPDPSYYNSGIFPRTEAEVLDETLLGGFNKVARVVINQCRYNHSESRLSKLEKIDLTLEWDDCANPANLHPIVPESDKRIEEKIAYTQKYVINPKDVTIPTFSKNRIANGSNVQKRESFEYLIVTTKDFAESLKPLEYMRKLRGFSTKIACIEDILADPKYESGDTISNLQDDAGRLRAYLMDVYRYNDTQLVLLAGKYPKIPVRETSFYGEVYCSDTYFGDFNTKWNTSQDIYMSGGTIDMELCIGRLNFKNTEEIDAYIEKCYYYEFNPGKGDPSYLDNSFVYVSTGDKSLEKYYPEILKPVYFDVFRDITEQFQEDYNYPKGKDVIDMLNNKSYGFVDFQCHGNPEGVQLTRKMNGEYRAYGINALDRETSNHIAESGNGLDCWKNKYFPNWSHSMSCNLMPFKDSYLKDGVTLMTYNFGESYTLGKDYGGVAFIGNTGDGFMKYSHLMQKYFFLEAIDNLQGECLSFIGDLHMREKTRFSQENKTRTYNHLISKLNIFGDPAIHLWFYCPGKINYNLSDKTYTTNFDNKYLTLISHSLVENIGPIFSGIESSWLNSYFFEYDQIHTVYAFDVIPFILPVKLVKSRFTNDNFIICNSIEIGATNSSCVTFKTGSDTTIHSIQNAIIDNNTLVEENAELKIFCKGSVIINSLTVQNGAKVYIEAPNIVINKNLYVEKGADFHCVRK